MAWQLWSVVCRVYTLYRYTLICSCVEVREEHVFKNYSAGEPSVRLYLKNLAKQVEETVRG